LRYLLIGNAPNCADAVAKAVPSADIIVQHNTCDYAELLPQVAANYVFITNSGPHARKITRCLLSRQHLPVFATTHLMLARNPVFYTFKKYRLLAQKHPYWQTYKIHWRWNAPGRIWPIETMPFMPTVTLERRMRDLGMEHWRMPSTGMIAYDWLCRRLQPQDCLLVAGFKFDNWRGHPRDVERGLIKPIAGDGLPPGRDAREWWARAGVRS
jgi:hypothetical protein